MNSWEMLLAQSESSRAKKFSWQPNERLYPSWMFVVCEECNEEHVLVSNPQKPCVMCRLRARASKPKWPDDYKGFSSNVTPRKRTWK